MHVLRVGRVLLPVLIVAAVVAAGSSVLSARPDLQKAKRNVDTSWSSLSGQLDHRYVLLAAVDDTLRPVVGPIRTLVGDVDTALVRWHDARQHTDVAAQVAAANDVEAFAPPPRDRGHVAARSGQRRGVVGAGPVPLRPGTARGGRLQPERRELRARTARTRAGGRGIRPRRRRDPGARHDGDARLGDHIVVSVSPRR